MLHELTKSPGRSKPGKRVGRGNANGAGNYCGRGLGGQNSRAGGWVPAWFEGGQTPLYRRLPKLRWFKRYFKLLKHIEPINLGLLEADERIKSWDTINKELLTQYGYIRKVTSGVKILWNGDLKKKLTFDGLDAISASALTKVEAAWGSFSGAPEVKEAQKEEETEE